MLFFLEVAEATFLFKFKIDCLHCLRVYPEAMIFLCQLAIAKLLSSITQQILLFQQRANLIARIFRVFIHCF